MAARYSLLLSEDADAPWAEEGLDEEQVQEVLAGPLPAGRRAAPLLVAAGALAFAAAAAVAAACLVAAGAEHRLLPAGAVSDAVVLSVVGSTLTSAAPAKAWNAGDVALTLLPADSGARCLDGSPAGFYLDRATASESKDKWALLLEGGFKCFDAYTCQMAAKGPLGSSTHFDRNLGRKKHYYWTSGDAQENPHFASWNRVYMPYCSQDLWSGTRTNKSAETFDLYFSGHVIIEVLLEYLRREEGMGMATDLVFGGYSAGGIGSWLNTRYVVEQLPSLQRVVHAPIAGFYLPAASGPFVDPNVEYMVRLWQSHLDDECTDNLVGEEYRCLLAAYGARYANWPIFVIQAQTDLVQLDCGAGCAGAVLEAWRSELMYALRGALKATDGWFAPACLVHHQFGATSGPWIYDPPARREVSYLDALWSFFIGNEVRLADECGTRCGMCGRSHAVRVAKARPAF